ncbi:hypothetical protein PPL_09572 [Heterostelium album PN500]|uniref:Uncharacterized protein n=1 Tax=Heterostelium pallidum (strain ATCC 26659 / Pp 5 / PN500) TaxID=670386 RepID=D3BNQ1_HETP5|nr:hypothetical protein PPL_09572 [Heterostelium album PN500]EFA76820.1 hypothetical protein PPL_09572 [Heterostelium album PN500]|eukprot:XP_020428952.1 hypothetical protein PPL_09572 [Heterostelium album PN500]
MIFIENLIFITFISLLSFQIVSGIRQPPTMMSGTNKDGAFFTLNITASSLLVSNTMPLNGTFMFGMLAGDGNDFNFLALSPKDFPKQPDPFAPGEIIVYDSLENTIVVKEQTAIVNWDFYYDYIRNMCWDQKNNIIYYMTTAGDSYTVVIIIDTPNQNSTRKLVSKKLSPVMDGYYDSENNIYYAGYLVFGSVDTYFKIFYLSNNTESETYIFQPYISGGEFWKLFIYQSKVYVGVFGPRNSNIVYICMVDFEARTLIEIVKNPVEPKSTIDLVFDPNGYIIFFEWNYSNGLMVLNTFDLETQLFVTNSTIQGPLGNGDYFLLAQ